MKIKSIKIFVIAFAVSILIVSGIALSIKNSSLVSGDAFYFMKSVGEKIDLHFLTFNAQDKQEKHLMLADKRLNEFEFLIDNRNTEFLPLLGTFNEYRKRLDSATFMAENLALIDAKFVANIELVYIETLNHLIQLSEFENRTASKDLREVALQYNSRSMKRLLQLHQYDENNTTLYKSLIEQLYEIASAREQEMGPEQLQNFQKAREVLDQGVELEYAHDLLVSTF